MLNLADGKHVSGRVPAVDSFEVRLEYLRQGGRLRETARALSERGTKTTHQNVEQHVARANRLRPLTYGEGTPEERRAVQAFLRYQLDRVGIQTAEPKPGRPDPSSNPIQSEGEKE